MFFTFGIFGTDGRSIFPHKSRREILTRNAEPTALGNISPYDENSKKKKNNFLKYAILCGIKCRIWTCIDIVRIRG